MTNYWLHRITGGANALPLAYHLLFGAEKSGFGLISIGWSYFSSDKKAREIQENGETALNQIFVEAKWGLPRNRWNLWRFLRGMKSGDIVVVPTGGEMHICEIADDVVFSNESIDPSLLVDWDGKKVERHDDGNLYNSEGKLIDLGFYRKVKLIETHIPRSQYADNELASRLKLRQTNAKISDLCDDVDKALERYREKKPINLKTQLINEISPTVLDNIKHLLDDARLETLVEQYFESLGARVETPSKNESPTEGGDADKVAYFDKLGVVVMAQVKAHKGYTDSWAVEQIRAYRQNHNYDGYTTLMWVISTCDDFSEGAKREADEAGVRLINGLEFAQMLLEVGLGGVTL